jgi:PhoD related phosphatase
LIHALQDISRRHSARITILGGDVHLGAIGQFYSNKKHGIQPINDYRYMPNVFHVLALLIVDHLFGHCEHASLEDCWKSTVLLLPREWTNIRHRRNKVHHLDHDTDEDMVPIFHEDVDRTPLTNTHLLPRRNWCSIVPVEGDEHPMELLVTLNLEVDCQNPEGTTKPYALRIPALVI